jgi:hypothetical protein
MHGQVSSSLRSEHLRLAQLQSLYAAGDGALVIGAFARYGPISSGQQDLCHRKQAAFFHYNPSTAELRGCTVAPECFADDPDAMMLRPFLDAVGNPRVLIATAFGVGGFGAFYLVQDFSCLKGNQDMGHHPGITWGCGSLVQTHCSKDVVPTASLSLLCTQRYWRDLIPCLGTPWTVAVLKQAYPRGVSSNKNPSPDKASYYTLPDRCHVTQAALGAGGALALLGRHIGSDSWWDKEEDPRQVIHVMGEGGQYAYSHDVSIGTLIRRVQILPLEGAGLQEIYRKGLEGNYMTVAGSL